MNLWVCPFWIKIFVFVAHLSHFKSTQFEITSLWLILLSVVSHLISSHLRSSSTAEQLCKFDWFTWGHFNWQQFFYVSWAATVKTGNGISVEVQLLMEITALWGEPDLIASFLWTAHCSFFKKNILLHFLACVNPFLGGRSRNPSHPPAVNKGTGSGCNKRGKRGLKLFLSLLLWI